MKNYWHYILEHKNLLNVVRSIIIMYKGKLSYLEKLTPKMGKKSFGRQIDGSSPPSVFVGRSGYPKVFVGPLVTEEKGDTSIMDTPEGWLGNYDAMGIASFRMNLVRGMKLIRVKDVESRTIEQMKDIALAKSSIDTETEFEKKPRGNTFHEEHQPFGPSAILSKMSFGNVRHEKNMEKAYCDTDLLSKDAIIELHKKNVLVTQIQKALSVGTFGIGKNRKLVPTRWSITAVDDILGKNMLENIKHYPKIYDYRVYVAQGLNNIFVIILTPTPWKYESMEAFFPQVIGQRLSIYSDYENYDGRKTYAQIGGCYYSAKMAVCEQLEKDRKQAGCIILREAYKGYIPLGVFNVREHVRLAMKGPYTSHGSLREALAYASNRLVIPINKWIEKGHVLRESLSQKTLVEY
jgi:DNA repair protein NreA